MTSKYCAEVTSEMRHIFVRSYLNLTPDMFCEMSSGKPRLLTTTHMEAGSKEAKMESKTAPVPLDGHSIPHPQKGVDKGSPANWQEQKWGDS
jgi:hypothetical protein